MTLPLQATRYSYSLRSASTSSWYWQRRSAIYSSVAASAASRSLASQSSPATRAVTNQGSTSLTCGGSPHSKFWQASVSCSRTNQVLLADGELGDVKGLEP